jgi:hypothetical protein
MPTPTADKLRTYFASRYLAADGDPLAQYTVDSATVRTLVDAALTEASGYWDGAVGWFDPDTTTPALQGAVFHVQTFDGATDTLTLSRDLPAAPQAGDTFRLALGGNRRSGRETFGMVVGGEMPEFSPVVCTNITGLTIHRASARLGANDLYIDYDQSRQEITIQVGSGGSPGPALDVSVDVTGEAIHAADDQGYIIVDVVAASLPGADDQEVFTLAYPRGYFCPDYEGYETGGEGKIRYRLEVCRNNDPADTMVDLCVHTVSPGGAATTIAAGQSLTPEAGTIDIDGGADWPGRSFWVRNVDANAGAGDCRYVKYRSGPTLYCEAASDWTRLAFDNGTNAPSIGDVVDGANSGASGRIVSIQLNSGDWSTNDAAGFLYLSSVTGDFNDNENLENSGLVFALADGADVKGLRDHTAANWNAGDHLQVMPDIDLGLDAPDGSSQFENPTSESHAPATITFSAPTDEEDALYMGDVASGVMRGVWRREWIMDNHRARKEIIADAVYFWA